MNKLSIVFLGMESRFTKIPLLKIVEKHNVVAIFESAPRNYERSFKKNIIKYIYNKYKELKYKKTRDLKNLSLKNIARNLNIPYCFTENISSKEVESFLKELGPDLICVSSLSQLIKRNIIDIPKYGVINFHPSYLPNYRGPNPWFWQYFNMEKEGGVTIHYIDDGEDTGNIIYQKKYPIKFGMKSEEMWDTAIPLGAELMLKSVDDIAEGKVKSHKQAYVKDLVRARNVNPNEKIIDWENWNIERIYHLLRGTYTWLNSIDGIGKFKKMSILSYEKNKISADKSLGLRYVKDSKEFVYCREGTIYIKTNFSFFKLIKALIKMN